MCYRRLLLFFVLIIHIDVYGQSTKDSLNITPEEWGKMSEALQHSTFHYSFLTDSFSRKGDSMNASITLLKISPYEFFYEDVTPDSIDVYIKRRFNVTEEARMKYALLFTKAYTAKRTPIYDTFAKMHDEDQGIRAEYSKRGDSTTRAINRQRLINTDSAHFDYLYKYVQKKGWPSLANGSMYAETIALHDHGHYNFYFPYLKKAVLKETVSFSTLGAMLLWRSYDHYYDEFQSCLETKSYVSFDVTSMFDHQLPVSLPEIEKAVEKYCPALLHLVIEAPNRNMYENLRDTIMEPWLGDHTYAIEHNIESKLEMDLVKYMTCSTTDPWMIHERKCDRLGIPHYPTWKVSDAPKPRLILYITYCRRDDDGFFSIIMNKKLTTHSIHFDVNSTRIKPESSQLLVRLADWLKKRANIKLEITGHTDNDGNAADNMKLSQGRAEAVMKQLVAYGVDSSRLTAKGYGATMPIQNNGTEEGKAENRRVEFIRK